MSIVYDAYPDTAYDPATGLRPSSTVPIEPVGGFRASRHRPAPAAPLARGFGNVSTRRMLEMGPPPKHPWLTVELAQTELAIAEYQEDRVQVAMDSIE